MNQSELGILRALSTIRNLHFGNYSVVEYTSLKSSAKEPLLPTRRNIEERLKATYDVGDVWPVTGKYWKTVESCLDGNEPDFEGEFDQDKVKEYGLCHSTIDKVIRYEDGWVIP
jgi:hypothetical protein